jgi:uncharacterized membrane protein YdbT with pleckstrin-like domain
MSYVGQTSGTDERVLYRTTYHWLYWLGGGLLTLAPVVALATLHLGTFVTLVTAGGAALAMPFGLYILIKALATEITITTDRFIKKSGLISFRSEDISLDKIEEIELHQSILGALLNYGTVEVRGSGAGSIKVEMVQSPERLRYELDAARSA